VTPASEIDSGNHISRSGTAGDSRRPTVNHRVVDLARGIVSILALKQSGAAKPAP